MKRACDYKGHCYMCRPIDYAICCSAKLQAWAGSRRGPYSCAQWATIACDVDDGRVVGFRVNIKANGNAERNVDVRWCEGASRVQHTNNLPARRGNGATDIAVPPHCGGEVASIEALPNIYDNAAYRTNVSAKCVVKFKYFICQDALL
ncbi:hypothetical protein EVAR_39769_1 [Eumeta japonica]|uniref:Uncharacterized protein n=1 Tax=Eumeta variegata TaxID=151549 RepID=A0A4C1X4J0_EUMVA|nr:hypothetical protein EVAR_39769_1 [Eumeta japonica]